jgi:hypothetical protein
MAISQLQPSHWRCSPFALLGYAGVAHPWPMLDGKRRPYCNGKILPEVPFADKRMGTACKALSPQAAAFLERHQDDPDLREAFRNESGRFQSVHAGHVHVHQNQLRV